MLAIIKTWETILFKASEEGENPVTIELSLNHETKAYNLNTDHEESVSFVGDDISRSKLKLEALAAAITYISEQQDDEVCLPKDPGGPMEPVQEYIAEMDLASLNERASLMTYLHTILIPGHPNEKTIAQLVMKFARLYAMDCVDTQLYTREDMISAAKYGYKFRVSYPHVVPVFENGCIESVNKWIANGMQK